MDDLLKPTRFLKRKKSVSVPGYFNGADYKLEAIVSLLSIPSRERTSDQISKLMAFTKDIKLFTELNKELDSEAHYQCCECLSISLYRAGEVTSIQFVFRQGDIGDKFYIILSGSVSAQASYLRIDGKTEIREVMVLRQGDCFGELGLLNGQPRVAGAMCREDLVVATLCKKDYDRIFARIQERLIQTKIEILLRQPIFKRLPRRKLQCLTYLFKIRKYKRKQTVFSAGSDSEFLYLVKEGEFELTKEVEMKHINALTAKMQKVKIKVTIMAKGEFIGSEDVIARRAYCYNCVCHSTTGELMAIGKKDFLTALGNEETLTYFSNLGKLKEEYRSARVQTATQVEVEKRTLLRPSFSPARHCSRSGILQDLSGSNFDQSVMSLPNSRKGSDKSLKAKHSRTLSQSLAYALEQSGIYAKPKGTKKADTLLRLSRIDSRKPPFQLSASLKSLLGSRLTSPHRNSPKPSSLTRSTAV